MLFLSLHLTLFLKLNSNENLLFNSVTTIFRYKMIICLSMILTVENNASILKQETDVSKNIQLVREKLELRNN